MPRNADTAPGTFGIPPFAIPLAPYLKTRQDALRTRQALTLYLQSHILFADDASPTPYSNRFSHLSLCAPNEAVVGVKCIPPDVTGLRKEYLKTLQENLAARKEYENVADNVTSRVSMTKTVSDTDSASREGVENNNSSPVLQDYLSLLHERRRYGKMQVFDRYLRELGEHDATNPAISSTEDRHRLGQDSFNDILNNADPKAEKAGETAAELLSQLERTVIRAKNKLDREQKRFKELQALRQVASATNNNRRAAALQKTRDELVHWAEETLAASNATDDGQFQESSLAEIENTSKTIQERKAEITEQYTAYLKARSYLLDVLSLTSQLSAKDGAEEARSLSRPAFNTMQKDPTRGGHAANSLAYANQVLHPLSKAQKSLALQRSYLSGLLAKEQSVMRLALDRLSHESHLLPEYPILARQPRFKHIVPAVGSRPNRTEVAKTEEIIKHAQAWAFASEAARSNEIDYVEQKIEDGMERAEDASDSLQQVYELLNQNYKETLQDEKAEEQNESDIWAAESKSTESKGRQRREDKRPKGPWSGLNGRVGVTGDI